MGALMAASSLERRSAKTLSGSRSQARRTGARHANSSSAHTPRRMDLLLFIGATSGNCSIEKHIMIWARVAGYGFHVVPRTNETPQSEEATEEVPRLVIPS